MKSDERLPSQKQSNGYAVGGVRQALRVEGLAVVVASLTAFWQLDGNWWWFFGLLLWPDLAFFAYIRNPNFGARVYNIFHSYSGPLLLGLIGIWTSQSAIVLFAIIWMSHIGVDRLAGYGLKYPSSPDVTHLGTKGAAKK